MGGEIEVDENYFGRRKKGKRGRNAAGKVSVFGLLKLGSKVHVAVMPSPRTETLFPIIRDKVRPASIVCIDSFRAVASLLKPFGSRTSNVIQAFGRFVKKS